MIGFQVIAAISNVRLPRGGAQMVSREIFDYFVSMQARTTSGVRDKMRQGVSSAIGVLSEKESVVAVVTPGMNPSLHVSSNSVKAAVDEVGRRPGVLPPFGPGSMLREWVIGMLNPEPAAIHAVTRRIAFNIQERGLPRPGDPLRAPFHTTFQAQLPHILEGLRRAGGRAVQRINLGTQ